MAQTFAENSRVVVALPKDSLDAFSRNGKSGVEAISKAAWDIILEPEYALFGGMDMRLRRMGEHFGTERLLRLAFGDDLSVRNGPFKGMTFITGNCAGSLLPSVLGSYEDCLHPWIEDIATRGYRRIMNIGSGDGYYSVGFALRGFAPEILAYDINPKAEGCLRRLMAANNIRSGITLKRECGPAEFAAHCGPGTLIFCDIEGAEKELLDPARSPELLEADFIVEIHDVFVPGTTLRLVDRFLLTHRIETLYEPPRDYAAYSIPHLPEEITPLIMDEHRLRGVSWMRLTRAGRV